MGKISKSGIASGTSGSNNTSLENSIAPSMNNAFIKINEKLEDQEKMAAILDEAGITSYTKEDLIFVTKDKADKIIFLEKGNSYAGLEHIMYGGEGKNNAGHLNDFVKKHGILKEDLVSHIKSVITDGELFCYRLVKRGYDRVYLYKNKYYMLAGVGTNGFITTCIPIDKQRAIKLKEKYKNERK